jgi:NAD(P)-dependent dehydrogenase (short-subunit alcohol dehydrogenase family)
MRDREFDGKVAVVTGAASGICRAIITAFVEQGARGVIADVDDEYGESTAAHLRAAGGRRATFARTSPTPRRWPGSSTRPPLHSAEWTSWCTALTSG